MSPLPCELENWSAKNYTFLDRIPLRCDNDEIIQIGTDFAEVSP